MPLGEGYWLNTRTGDEVEVYEHAKHVIDNPELFGLHPDAVAGKSGALYAQNPEMRRNLLTDVMKRGWIRVRSHMGRNVFETANVNDNALYSILEFAQRHNMWDNEALLIHDVTKPEGHGVTKISVGNLQKQFGMGEQLANVRKEGYSRVLVWTELKEGEDGQGIRKLRRILSDALHLILDPSQVPWSLASLRDNLDQVKLEALAYNYSMLTESELEPMPVYGLKTSMDHLDKLVFNVTEVIRSNLNRQFPSEMSLHTIEVEQSTTRRL